MQSIISCSTRRLIQNPYISLVNKLSTSLSENDNVKPEFYNRNPRNLERLRIAWRPYGYHLEQRGREYWHKLVLSHTGRHLTAQAVHYTGKVVVEATTKDWAIRKQLYKCTDRTAFESLARIFAQRCLECGLIEMSSTLKESVQPDTKIAKFVETVEKEGVALSEPPRYFPSRPWDAERPEKPWEIIE